MNTLTKENYMKLAQAVEYIKNKALDIGYTKHQISQFSWEIKDIIGSCEDCSVEELDRLFDLLF